MKKTTIFLPITLLFACATMYSATTTTDNNSYYDSYQELAPTAPAAPVIYEEDNYTQSISAPVITEEQFLQSFIDQAPLLANSTNKELAYKWLRLPPYATKEEIFNQAQAMTSFFTPLANDARVRSILENIQRAAELLLQEETPK